MYLYMDGYCVTKEYTKDIYISKTNKEACNWYGTDNYETKEGTIFTINNQSIKDYKIYGNSIQLVRSGKNLLNMEDFITSFTNVHYADKKTDFKLIPGKTYTLSFNYDVINATEILSTGIGYGTSSYTKDIIYSQKYPNQTSGRQTVTFTVPSDIGDDNYLYVRFARTDSEDSVSVDISKIQLEEGEISTEYEGYGDATPTPDNPSEIKSVGDLITSDNCNSYGSDACNNIGKYIIQVKTSGKNLFDISKVTTFKTIDYETEFPTYSSISDNIITSKIGRYAQTVVLYDSKMFLIPGTYTVEAFFMSDKESGNKEAVLAIKNYTNNKEYFKYTVLKNYKTWERVELSFTLDSKSEIVVVAQAVGEKDDYMNLNMKIKNIQIEEGNKATEYEPYVEPKVTNIYLDEPLRKVGDVVDYIDFENKQIVRNVKVNDTTGTKTIEESYSKQESQIEYIDLPDIELLEGYNNITINTSVEPSNVILINNK